MSEPTPQPPVQAAPPQAPPAPAAAPPAPTPEGFASKAPATQETAPAKEPQRVQTTVHDLLVAEQPGTDPTEVIHINPRFIQAAKVGESPRANRDEQVTHSVWVWLDSGKMHRLTTRFHLRDDAERLVRAIKQLW